LYFHGAPRQQRLDQVEAQRLQNQLHQQVPVMRRVPPLQSAECQDWVSQGGFVHSV
jgi:hypothetical protein